MKTGLLNYKKTLLFSKHKFVLLAIDIISSASPIPFATLGEVIHLENNVLKI